MRYVDIFGCRVTEYTAVRLTGFNTTAGRVLDISGVVGAISPADDNGPAAIKVWPDDGQLHLTEQERFEGKLWFRVADITRIEVLDDGC